jgi:hypothetical protein
MVKTSKKFQADAVDLLLTLISHLAPFSPEFYYQNLRKSFPLLMFSARHLHLLREPRYSPEDLFSNASSCVIKKSNNVGCIQRAKLPNWWSSARFSEMNWSRADDVSIDRR